MGVESAGGDVVDPRGESAADEAGDGIQLVHAGLAPAAAHFDLATLRGGADFAGAVNGGGGRVPEEVEGVVPGRARVEGLKGLRRVGALARVPAELAGVRRGDAVAERTAEGLGAFRIEGEADLGLGAAAAVVVEVAADPAVAEEFIRVACGVPDFHGAEMGAVRVGIAHALDDGEFAVLVSRA